MKKIFGPEADLDELALVALTLKGKDGIPIPNPEHSREAECGQSSSSNATVGVLVNFSGCFAHPPRISFAPWQKETWLTEVTVSGFTWISDQDVATVDWTAMGEADIC